MLMQPMLLLTHFAKGSSNALPAIFSVAQGLGATGIRKIGTPWPIIVGQSLLSVLLFWIGDKPIQSSTVPEPVWFGFKYALNTIRSLGAIVFLVIYIVHGGTFPSIGIMLMFESFMILSYPLKAEERTYTTYKVRGMRDILIAQTRLIIRRETVAHGSSI